MKALLELVMLWARTLVVLIAIVLTLAAVQQWDEIETQHVRASLQRGA
ncbi:hypothetical protein BX589_12032 [Paraburkholderia fungorum]|jgi:hypothetical protein|nr:hypothetical protein [Paraburkholderia fungorum]PRZ51191.1 hypothetical protein BX589_12032 [Paraburkholderia fungorum]